MGFKKIEQNFTFADAILKDSIQLNIPSEFASQFHRTGADKGYAGAPNRQFLAANEIADGIMRKDTTTAKLTDFEIERNKAISKFRYIVEQYFGISHLHDDAKRARFTTIAKNNMDCWCRQAAFNIMRGLKILKLITV